MITYFKKSLKDDKVKKLRDYKSDCWINVVNPTHKEIEYLAESFSLDKNNLNSGLDPHETPRVDFVGEDTYIYIKIPPAHLGKNLSTFLIVIKNKFILTLSKHEVPFVRNILYDKFGHFYTTQKMKFLLHILSLNNSSFENRTLEIVRNVETKINLSKELTEKDINNLIRYEYILNSFVSSYSYTNFMYNKIIHRLGFFEKDKDILEELIIDTEEGENICKTSLKNISNIRNYSIIILTSKLNRLISVLTVLTVFLSVIAATSSIYGMNVEIPLQNNPNAFFYIIIFMFVACIAFMVYLKKKRIF